MGNIHFSNSLCTLGTNFSLAQHIIHKYSFPSAPHFNGEISHPQDDIKIPEDLDEKSLAMKTTKTPPYRKWEWGKEEIP